MGTENFQFETPDPPPRCITQSELIAGCGTLSESPPLNGDIVYQDENTAYFTCDAGYTLVGAEAVSYLTTRLVSDTTRLVSDTNYVFLYCRNPDWS